LSTTGLDECTRTLTAHFHVGLLQASKASAAWRAYVDYVSDIVIQGFSNAITTSTRYLLQQLDPVVLARWVILIGLDCTN